MSRRVFELQDQTAFARLSGDWNPMHVDPLFARRLSMGLTVHGVHLLLWALQQVLAECEGPVRFTTLRATFKRPVRVGDAVELVIRDRADDRAVVDIVAGDKRMATVRMAWESSGAEAGSATPGGPFDLTPADLDFHAAARSQGRDRLQIDQAAYQAFPDVVRCAGPDLAALLLAATRIVGMKCPGLHSILAEIELRNDEARGETGVGYAVGEADERFNLLNIDVWSSFAALRIKALVRPKPCRQPSMETVAARIDRRAFEGLRALVVGGSRGLGELASKCLAAGGAEVWLTYRSGHEDAARVQAEIRKAGGTVEVVGLDVESPGSAYAALRDLDLSAALYFASPRIDLNSAGFDQALFAAYARYFVFAPAQIASALAEGRSAPLWFYYPSTVFLDRPEGDSAEYAAAKAAGEAALASLAARQRRLKVLTPRLPRLLTDQTAGVVGLPDEAMHIATLAGSLAPLRQATSP